MVGQDVCRPLSHEVRAALLDVEVRMRLQRKELEDSLEMESGRLFLEPWRLGPSERVIHVVESSHILLLFKSIILIANCFLCRIMMRLCARTEDRILQSFLSTNIDDEGY